MAHRRTNSGQHTTLCCTGALLMTWCLISHVRAQASSNDPNNEIAAVQAWLDGLQTQHDRLLDFAKTDDLFYAKWTRSETYIPSPERLGALRKDVADHPQHPDRFLLGRIEDRIRGPVGMTVECWIGAKMWRVAASPFGAADDFLDWGGLDDTAWYLDPGALSVSNFVPVSPEYGYAQSGLSFANELTYFFSCGLGDAIRVAPIRVTRVSDGAWIAEGSRIIEGRTNTVTARGHWNSVDRWGTVDEVNTRIVLADGTQTLLQVSSDSWLPPQPPLPAYARRVTTVETPPMYNWAYELTNLAPTTRDEIESRAGTPSLDRDDLVRGTPTFRTVGDYRGSGTYSTWDDAGTIESRQPLANISPTFAQRYRLRLVGWIASGCIVVFLVALRIRASVKTQS